MLIGAFGEYILLRTITKRHSTMQELHHIPPSVSTRIPADHQSAASHTLAYSSAVLVASWSWSSVIILAPAISRPAVLVFPSQSLQSLLLGVCVDVCADDETNEIEEWYPDLVGKEGLCKGQGDR